MNEKLIGIYKEKESIGLGKRNFFSEGNRVMKTTLPNRYII